MPAVPVLSGEQPPRSGPWPVALMLLLATGMAFYAPKAVEESTRSDMRRYYNAGAVVLARGDIYAQPPGLEFKYLPITAQLFAGIAAVCGYIAGEPSLPPVGSADAGLWWCGAIWYALLSLSYLLVLAMAVQICRPRSDGEAILVGLAGLIFSVRFFTMNVRLGQLNMFVLFWALLGCWLIVCRRQQVLGGMAIAFAMSIKFVPGGLIIWLAWRRMWRAAATLILAGAVFVCLAPMAAWGPAAGGRMLLTWIEQRSKIVTDLPEDQAPGQSLPSMVNRLCTATSAVSPRRGEPLYINVIDSRPLAKLVALALIAAACGFAITGMRGSLHQPDVRACLELALVFALLLMASPESRRAHFVPILLAGAALVRYGLEYGGWRAIAPCLAFAFACTSLSSAGIWGHGEAYYWMNACGVVLIGLLALFWCLRRRLLALR